MAKRLRVLFAALSLPFPPTNGHRLRTSALLRALAEDGHQVTLVSFIEPKERNADLRSLRNICQVFEPVPTPVTKASGPMEAGLRLLALASPLPYGAWKFRSSRFRRSLERHLVRDEFDLIICDGIYNVQNLPPRSDVPVLLNKDDVAHVIFDRYLKLETSAARHVYGVLEARKIKRWERSTCQRMSGVLTCSAFDRAILQGLCPGVPMFVVPNTVETDYYTPAAGSRPGTVLFQGGMDWYPNRDAVEFFVAQVLPELGRLVPGVTFRVAGRSPSDAFRRRLDGIAGVEFTGTVPDMRREIAEAAVCVVPLRIASGTRLKILEAAAMQKPIVSTPLGAEGLEFLPGDEILLAEEPTRFASEVASLLRDEARCSRLGSAARRRVEKQYSFPVLQAQLRWALAEVIS